MLKLEQDIPLLGAFKDKFTDFMLDFDTESAEDGPYFEWVRSRLCFESAIDPIFTEINEFIGE